MIFNFKEILHLEHKVGGFINRIASPKAYRKFEATGEAFYSFDMDYSSGYICDQPDCKDIVDRSIWVVVDICRWYPDDTRLVWNVYLVVSNGKKTYPVAEYLDSPKTLWVKKARPLVKAFFAGENLPEIELTPQPKKAAPKDHRKESLLELARKHSLQYGEACMSTLSGKRIGVFKILRHNSKYIEITTKKGVFRFKKEDGRQVAENPKYTLVWNLEKED